MYSIVVLALLEVLIVECSSVNQPRYKGGFFIRNGITRNVLKTILLAICRKDKIHQWKINSFQKETFKIQIRLFTLFCLPEYFRGLLTLAVYIMCHLYSSTVKSRRTLVPLLFHCQ